METSSRKAPAQQSQQPQMTVLERPRISLPALGAMFQQSAMDENLNPAERSYAARLVVLTRWMEITVSQLHHVRQEIRSQATSRNEDIRALDREIANLAKLLTPILQQASAAPVPPGPPAGVQAAAEPAAALPDDEEDATNNMVEQTLRETKQDLAAIQALAIKGAPPTPPMPLAARKDGPPQLPAKTNGRPAKAV